MRSLGPEQQFIFESSRHRSTSGGEKISQAQQYEPIDQEQEATQQSVQGKVLLVFCDGTGLNLLKQLQESIESFGEEQEQQDGED